MSTPAVHNLISPEFRTRLENLLTCKSNCSPKKEMSSKIPPPPPPPPKQTLTGNVAIKTPSLVTDRSSALITETLLDELIQKHVISEINKRFVEVEKKLLRHVVNKKRKHKDKDCVDV